MIGLMSGTGIDRGGEKESDLLLNVEYPDIQSFLSDFQENISKGSTFVSSQRQWSVDDHLSLTLSFPGLLHPIQIQGIVSWARIGHEPGVGVDFQFKKNPKAKTKLQKVIHCIENGDPLVVAPLVRVLVAEDNIIIFDMIREGLNRHINRTSPVPAVFYFYSARDGAEALKIIEQTPIDLMIADFYLPILGEEKLILKCRELLGPTLPIISISAGGEDAEKLALASGADIFIPKPLRLAQVFTKLSKLLNLSS